MNESDIRVDIRSALMKLKFWPIHSKDASICPRCGASVLPGSPGRPDLLVLKPLGQGIVVEVKRQQTANSPSFAIAKIEQDQRDWMNRWEDEGGMAFFGFGTVVPRKRSIWVIPWGAWKEYEQTIGSGSAPISRSLYSRFPKNERPIDEEFRQYELNKVVGGFEFPDHHIITRISGITWTLQQ